MAGMLRDLIYFDFDRVSSLISQIEGGLKKQSVEGQKISASGNLELEGKLLSLAKMAGKGDLAGSLERVQTKAVHHETLAQVESYLNRKKLLQKLDSHDLDPSQVADDVRARAERSPYLQTTGYCNFEIYSNISNLFSQFRELTTFINRCHSDAVQSSEGYKQIRDALDQAKRNSMKGAKADRENFHREVRKAEALLAEATASSFQAPEQHLLDGIQLWIKTFAPNRRTLRVIPFEQNKNFQVICDLKADCFVDGDVQRLLMSYGSFPSVKLGLIGLITGIPSKADPAVRPEDFVQNGSKEDEFVGAFQNLFLAASAFERFLGLGRYPNIFVQPLAIYRDFQTS